MKIAVLACAARDTQTSTARSMRRRRPQRRVPVHVWARRGSTLCDGSPNPGVGGVPAGGSRPGTLRSAWKPRAQGHDSGQVERAPRISGRLIVRVRGARFEPATRASSRAEFDRVESRGFAARRFVGLAIFSHRHSRRFRLTASQQELVVVSGAAREARSGARAPRPAARKRGARQARGTHVRIVRLRAAAAFP
jgi:hypothetical protein